MEKQKRDTRLFVICVIIILFVLGFFSVRSAHSQSCPLILEHKGARVTLAVRVTEVRLFYNNPRFKVGCGQVKLVRKNSTSPIKLRYEQYGPVLKFWPQKRLLDGEDYILMIDMEKYPIHISKR
jgi:hypothetical protein